jgi:hypothetical protein
MSQENVEVVERFLAASKPHDLVALRDDETLGGIQDGDSVDVGGRLFLHLDWRRRGNREGRLDGFRKDRRSPVRPDAVIPKLWHCLLSK